jgi:hypothetical protein
MISLTRGDMRSAFGTFGAMGVGQPFGLRAEVASPGKQVVVLHGGGSFGINGLELNISIWNRIPVRAVISLRTLGQRVGAVCRERVRCIESVMASSRVAGASEVMRRQI